MKKMAKILLIGLGFGSVTAVLGLLTSKPTTAQLPPAPIPVVSVKVTNTPLPITGSVNVTNSPLPVQGTVAVSSLPPVTVSGLSSVTVGNGATNPALVSNVNDSTDREFTGSVCEADYSNPPDCNATFDPFHNEFVSSFTLPTTTASGLPVTQAVIEYVSGSCRADLQDDIGLVGMLSSSNAAFYFAPVKLPGVQRLVFPVPGQNSPTTWQWSQTTKIYLPPGASLFLNVRSTGNQFELEECFTQFWGTLLTR